MGKGSECKFAYFGASTETMHVSRCKNCDCLLAESHNFCPSCGQKSHLHRFSLRHLLHEFFHAFTHADKGLIFLLKGLATKPGIVVAEYIDGKRKKYFNPFTFFLLCIGFFVFMNTILKPNGEMPKPDVAILAKIPSPKGKEQYLKAMERRITVFNITQKNANILALTSLPLNAFFFWIFFRKRQRNYAEFIIAMVFLAAFANLIFSIFISPLMSLTRVAHPTVYWSVLIVGLLLQAAYISWGIKGLLNAKVRTRYWEVFPIALLYNIIWGIGSALFFLWYVARERTGMVIGQLWHQLLG